MEEKKVRCADCGYLALRLVDTREIVEAEALVRETGTTPGGRFVRNGPITGQEAVYMRGALCFRGVWSVVSQSRETPSENCAVIQFARDCEMFTPWKPGFSPKEHAEQAEQERRERVEAERHDQIIETQKQSAFLGALFGLIAGAISGPLIEGCRDPGPKRPAVTVPKQVETPKLITPDLRRPAAPKEEEPEAKKGIDPPKRTAAPKTPANIGIN